MSHLYCQIIPILRFPTAKEYSKSQGLAVTLFIIVTHRIPETTINQIGTKRVTITVNDCYDFNGLGSIV